MKKFLNGWMISGVMRLSEPLDYAVYFKNLLLPKEAGLSRANIQSPFRHFIFEVKRIIRLKDGNE